MLKLAKIFVLCVCISSVLSWSWNGDFISNNGPCSVYNPCNPFSSSTTYNQYDVGSPNFVLCPNCFYVSPYANVTTTPTEPVLPPHVILPPTDPTDPSLPKPSSNLLEICFTIDVTDSMQPALNRVTTTIKKLISDISKTVQTGDLILRFAVVAYRDHYPQSLTFLTQSLNFTDDVQALKFLSTLTAADGNDVPEAVHDALLVSSRYLNWTQTEASGQRARYIFHITDAPPHGSQFLTRQPQLGCTCGNQTSTVLSYINTMQIKYRLIHVYHENQMPYAVQKMKEIFQKNITNFGMKTVYEPQNIDVQVSKIILDQIV